MRIEQDKNMRSKGEDFHFSAPPRPIVIPKGQGLERTSSNSFYIFLLEVNFENLTVEFYDFYVLNMQVKFHSNQMLFTI